MHYKKRIHLSKRGKLTLVGILSVVIITGTIFYFKTRPLIVFHHRTVEVEINGSLDPISQIKKVRQGSVDEINVDFSLVDFTTLGEYKAFYTYHDKSYTLMVKIVDTTAPTFDVIEGTTDAGIEIDPSTLVTNIQDATKTVATFKEHYDFSQEGSMEVVVVLSDEGKNKSEKTTQVTILPEDTTAPEISGETDLTLQQGATFNPLESIHITDNQDPNPTLTLIENNLDTDKIGTYELVYEGQDRSGNKTNFTKTIKIVEKTTIGRYRNTGENIVYLTFDDGPSYNTPLILDILDRYQVKATFFVTGNGAEYNDCISRAYKSGHTIALHTYSHDYEYVYSSKENYFKDLNQVAEMVEQLTGHRSHYIRFPGGSSNTVSANYSEGIMSDLTQEVIDRGFQYYDWNVGSADADGNYVDPDKIIANATNHTSGNAVILFHDARGKDTTVEALPAIIEYYLDLGFSFSGITDESYTAHHGVNN